MAEAQAGGADETPSQLEDVMTVMPLGSGQEVGRSCHLIKFRGRSVLLDCGVHPGRSGLDALPFLDTVDLSTVDLLLVSHFHIDHAAGVPYLTEKTAFKGRIFMTHATKAVMQLLLSDYLRLLPTGESEAGLYDEDDLRRCLDRVELVDFHQVVEHKGIRFSCYNAGHVLGAAMFMIEIGGARLLYTGDYSLEEDRHLVPAEVPREAPHVLVMEATYGTQRHEPRDVREALFTSTVERVVQRGGRCLIPVFALGRAQELLLILDEYWRGRRDLHRVPVFYASKLAARALRVYQTYINMMNEHIRRQMDVRNPFRFSHVANMGSVDDVDDVGPCVVLASPGMLQSGVSRQLFDRWCTDPRNGVIIAGYAVEGTLAKKLMAEPDEVATADGRVQPRRCTVVSISFSAHTDYFQNAQFVEATRPANIILVHGEKNEMGRLKGKLHSETTAKWGAAKPSISMPENGQPVNMRFQRDRACNVIGAAVDGPTAEDDAPHSKKRPAQPGPSRRVRGVLVSKDLRCTLYTDAELVESSPLAVTALRQTLRLQYANATDVLVELLRQTFADVRVDAGACGAAQFTVGGEVECDVAAAGDGAATTTPRQLTLRWAASPAADMIADAIVAVALHAMSSPAALARLSPLGGCCALRADEPGAAENVARAVAELVRATLVAAFGAEAVEDDAEPAADAAATSDEPAAPEPAAASEPAAAASVVKLRVTFDAAVATCHVFADSPPASAAAEICWYPSLRVDVSSEDDSLRKRLDKLIQRTLDATAPISI